jgi:hypothetical protein
MLLLTFRLSPSHYWHCCVLLIFLPCLFLHRSPSPPDAVGSIFKVPSCYLCCFLNLSSRRHMSLVFLHILNKFILSKWSDNRTDGPREIPRVEYMKDRRKARGVGYKFKHQVEVREAQAVANIGTLLGAHDAPES